MAVDSRGHPAPWLRVEMGGRWQNSDVTGRRRDNGSAERMLAADLSCGGEHQHGVSVHSIEWYELDQLRRTDGQRARLVECDHLDVGESLHHDGRLDEHAMTS